MRRFLVITLVVIAVPACAQESSFSDRAKRLLDVVSREREVSPYVIAAKVRTGTDLSGAHVLLDSLTRDRAIGGMFYAYSLIGAYLHVREGLPDSLHAKVRKAFRDRTMYRGDTENHWVMYYTGMYLAAQTWPREGRDAWFNGKSSDENFREAADWLSHWMRISSTIGQGEFDSPTYITTFITPMMVLHEFAADPAMKNKAQMMLDLLFADFAAEHLEGNYGGGHSRDYPEDIINPLGAPSTMWAWLYFGKPEFAQWEEARYRPRNRGGWETAFGALGSYRLPEIIRLIATDRREPYVHTETKRVRNIIRMGTEKNPPAYKYTYVTPDYILGSLSGGILQPIQQHTWDITYASDKPNNTIFILHPYYSGKELAMFFPEEIRFLSDEVDRYHLVYTSPDKWNSSSPYERTFQHKGTLIALYDIRKGEMQPHIDGFFPKNLDERILDKSGWILCRAGDVYVGVYPLRGGEWKEEKVNWRWRSGILRNGVIVETGSKREDGSFSAFRQSLTRTRIDSSGFANDLTVGYRNRHGIDMTFSFDGLRMLNGKRMRLEDYQFFDGPYIQSERGSGRITLRHGSKTRILDFNKGDIIESK